MHEAIRDSLVLPASTSQDVLTGLLRQGAQRLLAQAIDAEVAEWIESHRDLRDQAGHRQVVRNGRLPKRTILSGVGQIEVEQPRVLDRRPKDESEFFSSKILPPYLRKTKSLEELIPWLYLHHDDQQPAAGGTSVIMHPFVPLFSCCWGEIIESRNSPNILA